MGICLGVLPVDTNFYPRNQLIQSFDIIGYSLRSSYDMNQCQRFYDEVARFMAASEVEQAGRLKGQVFTLEEYWAFRMGTSAVYISSAASEYSMSLQLPLEVMRCDSMRVVWDEVNVIISITNDLLSLRKEIKHGCIDSIVPLTFASTNSIQEAISEAVSALRVSKNRFDKAANSLLVANLDNREWYEQIQRFMAVQRSNSVGNLLWR